MAPGVEAVLDAYGTVREPISRRVGADAITACAAETISIPGGVADIVEYEGMQRGLSNKQPRDISAEQALPAVGKTVETGLELCLDSNLENTVMETSDLYKDRLNEIRAQYSPQQRDGPLHDCHECRTVASEEHFHVYTCTDDPPADLFERILTTRPRKVIEVIDQDLWTGFRAKLVGGRISREEQVEKLAECFHSMAACGNVYNINNREALQRGLNDMRSFTPA